MPPNTKKDEIKEIEFKSLPDCYKKEESGVKPNTFRVDMSVIEKTIEPFKLDFIKIVNSETKEHFKRRITDITLWGGWYIFSWNPNEKLLSDFQTYKAEKEKTDSLNVSLTLQLADIKYKLSQKEKEIKELKKSRDSWCMNFRDREQQHKSKMQKLIKEITNLCEHKGFLLNCYCPYCKLKKRTKTIMEGE